MQDAPRRLVPVIGESGTGKSSLPRAGLMNSARAPARVRLGWRSAFLSLSERLQHESPLQFLARSLVDPEALPELGSPDALCQRLDGVSPDEAARRLLHAIAMTRCKAEPGVGRPKLLVVVDQCEIAIDEARLGRPEVVKGWSALLHLLAALGGALLDRSASDLLEPAAQEISSRMHCSVVLGLPADRISVLGTMLQLGDHVFTVPRVVDDTAIREIIVGTFTKLGLTIHPAACAALCHEAIILARGTEASILPLLSVALSALHEDWKWRRAVAKKSLGRHRKSARAKHNFWGSGTPSDDEPQADIELDQVHSLGQLDQAIERLGELAWSEASTQDTHLRSLIEALPISVPRHRMLHGEIEATDFALIWLLRHLVAVSPDERSPDRLIGLPDSALHPVARPIAEALRRHRLLTVHDDATWWLVHQSVLRDWKRAAEWRAAEPPLSRTAAELEMDRQRWVEEKSSGFASVDRRLWTEEREVERALDWIGSRGSEANQELVQFARAGMIAAVRRDPSRAGRLLRASTGFCDGQWTEEILLAAGDRAADEVNHIIGDRVSPLYNACLHGSAELANLLISAGADCALIDAAGRTPLHAAAVAGADVLCERLLAAGADVDHLTRSGTTPLMWAAERGRNSTLHLLLKAGAQVNQTQDDGRTSLFLAAENGHACAVEILLAAGADPNLANNDGYTSLAAAAENGHVTVLGHLLKAGATVNELFRNGFTALIFAAANGHLTVVDRLLNAGAEISVNINGRTALYWASQNGHAPSWTG